MQAVQGGRGGGGEQVVEAGVEEEGVEYGRRRYGVEDGGRGRCESGCRRDSCSREGCGRGAGRERAGGVGASPFPARRVVYLLLPADDSPPLPDELTKNGENVASANKDGFDETTPDRSGRYSNTNRGAVAPIVGPLFKTSRHSKF